MGSMSENKINLVLDLDNTLISSVPLSSAEKSNIINLNSKDMDTYYRVYYRPGLEDFLNYIFDNFTGDINFGGFLNTFQAG